MLIGDFDQLVTTTHILIGTVDNARRALGLLDTIDSPIELELTKSALKEIIEPGSANEDELRKLFL